MQLINTTARLIEHTQNLIIQCLESGNYGEAIAFSGLLKDLSESYKSLASAVPPTPVVQIQRPGKLIGAGLGAAAFNSGAISNNRFTREKEPVQPTQYKWPDGFNGVTLPPTEEQGNDYWAE